MASGTMQDMCIEAKRLQTFSSWPTNVAVDPHRIAKAGFFSTGNGLEVQCFACGGRISSWNYGDQVMAKHRNLNALCPFVKDSRQSGNVPILKMSPTSPTQYMGGDASAPGCSRSASTPSVSQAGQPQQIRNVKLVSKAELYHREGDRLSSFANWPIPFIKPQDLARAGFYYMQEEDKVQCAFCSGIVGRWERGDDPITEHKRHFPSCSYLNMVICSVQRDVEMKANKCPEKERQKNFPAALERHVETFNNEQLATVAAEDSSAKELGIQSHKGPRHPRYATFESRLRTFTEWPSTTVEQTPEEMAQAGFYYVGLNDHVRCFHCDGGLRHWEPGDHPWQEHARWFPNCGFVALVKGEDFTKQAIIERPPIMPEEMERPQQRKERPVVSAPQQPAGHRIRGVTEEELQGLMNTSSAVAALQIGLDASRIKMALRQKMEQTGLPFASTDALIEAALDVQMEEDTRDVDDGYISSGACNPGSSQNAIRWIDDEHLSASDTTDDEEDEASEVGGGEGYDEGDVGLRNSDLEEERMVTSTSTEDPSQVIAEVIAEESTHQAPASWPDLLSGEVGQPYGENEQKAENGPASAPFNLAHELSADKNVLRPIAGVSLEEENRRLKEAKLCKICMDEEVGVVFLPCGHLITCVQCAPILKDCPMCRQPIKASVRAFLS